MAFIQNLGFEGHWDYDSDPTKVLPGNYTAGHNLQFLTKNTRSTKSHIPMRGNVEAFSLGTTSMQNKTWRITTPQDATNDNGGIFLYDQNGNLFPTISGQAQPMEWNRNQSIANQRTAIAAMFATIDGSGTTIVSNDNTHIFITTTTVDGYDIGLKATTTTGATPTTADTSLDPQIYQEAYDESMAENNQAIGSFDLLGDLYIWSTPQTHLPTVITPTITTVADNGSGRYRVTTSADHGLTTGWKVAISGVNVATPGVVSPNGLWIITVISATVFDVQEWYTVTTGFVQGAAGGNVTIHTQGVGIVGVAQFDANTDTWTYTKIAETIQWNFTTKKQIDTYAERNAVKDSIYWTDDFNVPRCLYYIKEYDSNGVLQPYVANGVITVVNAAGIYSYATIDQETRLQLISSGTQLSFVQQIQSGGAVAPGNWRYAVRLLTSSLTSTEPGDLTNPVNVCAALLDGDPTLIIGNAPGDSTPKINQVEVTGILPGLFKYVELIGVNYIGDGMAGYVIKRVQLSNTQDSVIINHTGNETGVTDFDLGLLNQKFAQIATARNIDVIDKRMILSNLTLQQRTDFSAWVETFTHNLNVKSIDSVRGAVQGTLRMAEYQDPENVNRNMGYMQNETYRFGFKFRLKGGGITETFWCDDVCFTTYATNLDPNGNAVTPNRRTAGLPNFKLTDATGVTTTVYVPYVNFDNIDLDYLIDGVRVRDLIEAIIPMRAECVPEVLACGVAALAISGSAYGGSASGNPWIISSDYPATNPYGGTVNDLVEYPFISGRVGTGGAPNNPAYPNSSGAFGDNMAANRKFAAFYSPDVWFEHVSFTYQASDQVINFGNPVYVAFNNGYASNPPDAYSNYAQVSGDINVNNPLLQLQNPTDAVLLENAASTVIGAVTFSKATAITDGGSGANGYGYNPQGYLFKVPVDFSNPTGATDYGLRYMQYYRALTDKYGDTNLTEYVTCGTILEIDANSATVVDIDVFGGDAFTQLMYFRHRQGNTIDNGFAGGISFYSQNRVNAQMKQKSVSQSGDLYPGISTAAWLESPANTDGTNGEAYQEGYTIRNEVQSTVAFDPDLEDTNDYPARIMWSDIKAQGSPQDNYRNFLPLNFHDLDQTFGEIVHHANANGELITWQLRAFMRQYFDTRGTLQAKGIGEILIGDGAVMSRDGVTVSRLGCKHKWAIIKGKSNGGNDTFYWINTELKKALRFGYDGTVSVADIKDMRSFLGNNLTWADQYDTPADGWGICGTWNDRYSDAIWSVRARRTTDYTYDATTNWTNIGRLVYYEASPQSVFERTGDLFLVKFANGPATVVVTPVAVYPVPLTISTLTGTTVLTITTASPHKLVTGDQVKLRYIAGLSADINNGFHTVTVTGASTFTITVSALVNYYTASSGQIIEVNPKYWEFIPHTDSDYWNEYSLIFNEVKNGFTFTTSPKPKIYLKWTDSYLSPRPIAPEYKVYEHNLGDYLTWYLHSGESQQERGYIEGVVNMFPDEIKWMEAIGADTDIAPERMEFTTEDQESYLLDTEFTSRLRSFYSPVKQDSTNNGINNGGTSLLYGHYIKVKMFFEVDVYQKLEGLVAKFRVSPRLKQR